MPGLHGESVGSAYVRIYADGRGMRRDIENELDGIDAGGKGRDGGEEFGDEWGKGFDRRYRSNYSKTLKKSIADSRNIGRQNGQIFGGEMFKNIEKRLHENFPQMGGRVADELIDELRKRFVDSNLGEDFFKGGDESQFAGFLSRSQKLALDYQIEIEKLDDKATQHRIDNEHEVEQETERSRTRSRKDYSDGVDGLLRESKRLASGQGTDLKTLRRDMEAFKRTTTDLRRVIGDLGFPDDEVRRFHDEIDRAEGSVRRINPRFRNLSGNLLDISDNIGRSFGRGSRNNALNFFGSVTEKAVVLASQVFKLGDSLTTVFKALKAGDSVLAALKSGFAGTAEGATSLASAATGAAIAIPIIVVIVGTLVSVFSLLLGVIVALASSLAFALVGALGAVAGALVPLAFGVGVVVAAIASMSDAQKKALKTAIKPFVAGIKELGKAAADSIFGGDQFTNTIARITSALKGSEIETLVRGIGGAIGNVGNMFASAIDSPGFKDFVEKMSLTLPSQITGLGEAFRNLFGGLGGLIIGLQPITNSFIGWLVSITDRFREFANSPDGQKKIVDFFERAQESIISVGHFLKEVGGLLVDLLFNTQGGKSGNSIFDDMAKAVKKFRDYLQEINKETGNTNLEQWFIDAKDFADNLGDSLKTLGELLDALDSPGFRTFADLSIKTFTELFETLGNIIRPIIDLVDALDALVHLDFSGAGDAMVSFFKDLGVLILDALTLGFGNEVIDLLTKPFQGVVDKVKEIFGIHSPSTVFIQIGADIIAGLIGGLVAGIEAIYEFFRGLLFGIGSLFTEGIPNAVIAVGGFLAGIGSSLLSGMGDILSQGKDKITDFAGYLGSKFSEGASAVGGAVSNVAGYLSGKFTSSFNSAKGVVTGVAGYLAGGAKSSFKSLQNGTSDLAGWVGGKLVDAFKGAKNAASNIKDFLGGLISKFDSVKDAVGRLISKLAGLKPPGWLTGSVGKLIGAVTAKGGVFMGAQNRIIGEAGPEAVVPLNRPLSLVDPAVRELSAFAQGKMRSSSGGGGGSQVDASGWTIVTPSKNPAAVAKEVLNELTGKLL